MLGVDKNRSASRGHDLWDLRKYFYPEGSADERRETSSNGGDSRRCAPGLRVEP
jgi:hypothetical protein